MMNVGDGPKKIDIPVTGNSLTLTVPLPSRGDIWVEPVGRQRKFDSGISQKLSFCCLPKCKLIWPERLLAYNEKTVVKLKGTKMFPSEWAVIVLPWMKEKKMGAYSSPDIYRRMVANKWSQNTTG